MPIIERSRVAALVDHEVVGEEHRERLVTHVMSRDRNRVTETERIALTDVVDVGEVGGELHLLEHRVLARGLEVVLELEVAIEVVFDGPLVAARDDEDVGEPGLHGLFHDVLDRGPIDDRQHLLRGAFFVAGRNRVPRPARRESRLFFTGCRTGAPSVPRRCAVRSSTGTRAEVVLLASQQASNVTEVPGDARAPRSAAMITISHVS